MDEDFAVMTGGMGHYMDCGYKITSCGIWQYKCVDMAGGPIDAPEYIAAGASEPIHYGRGPSVRIDRVFSGVWLDSQGRLRG